MIFRIIHLNRTDWLRMGGNWFLFWKSTLNVFSTRNNSCFVGSNIPFYLFVTDNYIFSKLYKACIFGSSIEKSWTLRQTTIFEEFNCDWGFFLFIWWILAQPWSVASIILTLLHIRSINITWRAQCTGSFLEQRTRVNLKCHKLKITLPISIDFFIIFFRIPHKLRRNVREL